MELKMYQVDAFTDQLFSGNPAAVVVLESPIADSLMLARLRWAQSGIGWASNMPGKAL